MARKSKDRAKEELLELRKIIWRAALYIRLSREDGDKEESDSISNQKDYLIQFLEQQEDILFSDFYIDDGWSGTHFERPSFQKMMEKIRKSEINCVIVKDLSRFGRNYIETGNYLEQIFPFLKVRFISINDMLDSIKNPGQMNTILVPFKNLINDEYCRDISNKIRSSLDSKRRKGEFIGSFVTYGYQKDPDHKGKIIVEEETAAVVKMIFEWFLNGIGCMTIAKKLNDLGIPNPTLYKKRKGLHYQHPTQGRNDGLWGYSTIKRMLHNRMYCGDMVQGVNQVTSYKVQKMQRVPEENWFIVENTHEAIIQREEFQKIQSLLERDTRKSPVAYQLHLFAGFMKCADCKKAMNRRKNTNGDKVYEYYVCSTYKKQSRSSCTRHTMRVDLLEKAVLQAVRVQIALAVDISETLQEIEQSRMAKEQVAKIPPMIDRRKRELEQLVQIKSELYTDWKSGVLTKEEYLEMKFQYTEQIEEKKEQLRKLEDEFSKEEEKGLKKENAFLSAFIKHYNITELTRNVLVELVEDIYVQEGNRIIIKFKFRNELENILEFMKKGIGEKIV